MIQCGNCQRIFKSGIMMGSGSSATFIGNKSQCPFCGSMENIPNGKFMATVNGFVDLLKGSRNPLQDALDIYNGLKNVRDPNDLSEVPHKDKIEGFLERNKLKITMGLAILKVIIDLLKSQPDIAINNTIINDNFYTQYNKTIIVEPEK